MTLMIITTVVSLRGLASQAEFGIGSIFYYLLSAVMFLLPFSLVCAELASMFPQKGGVYRWTSAAFGQRTGWVAMFCEWWWVVVWFPTVLMFGAAALAYVAWPQSLDHELASSRVYTAIFVLGVFWLSTLNTLRGLRSAARLATWAGVCGTMLPAAILIVLGIIYVATPGHTVDLGSQGFWPEFHGIDTFVLAASIFLFFGGIEVQAVHVPRMADPARQFPRAIMIAVASILVLFIGGTLALGAIVPRHSINLLQTLLVGYRDLWATLGAPWAGNIMAALVTFGVVGQITANIAGPTTGLLDIGHLGLLPPWLQRVNGNQMPAPLLIAQAVIVTVLVAVMLAMPSVQSAYQLLSQLSSVIYLIMAITVYVACLRLRRHHPEIARPFKIPGRMPGVWLVCGLGIVGALAALILSFLPPSQIATGSPAVYVGILVGATAVSLALPMLIYRCRKPSWAKA